MFRTILWLTIAAWAGLVLTSLVLAMLAPGLAPGEQPLSRQEMRKHTLWLFYCNPDDPRGLVPKLRGPGGTVNVRTRSGAIVMLFFTIATGAGVLATVASALFMMLGR